MANVMKEWENYIKGKTYNQSMPKDFYVLCNTNADFDNGDQWPNAGLDEDFQEVTFNIVNKMTTFFVAYIVSSDVAVNYKSLVKLGEGDLSDTVLTASFNEFKERVKFSKKFRQALKDGTITGDYISHFTFTDEKPYDGAFGKTIGQVNMDLVDATNFYVANPRSNDVQKQKYIMIDGRSFVSELQDEQDEFLKDRKEANHITEDGNTETTIGEYGDIEFNPILDDDGKETGSTNWVLVYTKKEITKEVPVLDEQGNETGETEEETEEWVFSTKLTENGYIWKDRAMGFNMYPCELGNWIEQKNCYHGQSFVKGVISVQIFINQLFAAAMKHTLDTAFEKFFYNSNFLPDGINNEVSAQVGVDLPQGMGMDSVGKFMSPGNMSDKVIALIDLAYTYIKDVVSMTDAITGNINPEQASGVSIVSASKQAAIPIEVPQLNAYDWVEGNARIYKNIVENLYGERAVLVEEDGETVVGTYDFAKLKKMYKQPTIEVGESSYWSEDNMIRTIDNLFSQGILDAMEYIEEIPSAKLPNKEELLKKMRAKAEMSQPVTDGQDQLTPEMMPQV